MYRRLAFLLFVLSTLALTTATAQKTIISKKNPISTELSPAVETTTQGDLIARGDSCMLQFDTHAALSYYQQAYNQSPTLESLQKLANCLYQRCDYRQCAMLLASQPINNMSHDALRQLFFCYSYLKKDQQLMDCGQELLKRFPMDAEVLARLCTVLCDQEKAQEAVNHAQAYFRRDSTNLLINRTLANSLYLSRNYQAAIQQYQRLMAAGDTTFLGLYSTGMAYDYLGKKKQAYDYLLMATQKNTKIPSCHYRLGVVCVHLGRYEEALDQLYSAEFQYEPDRHVMKIINDYKAQAFYATEKYSLAIEAWKKAREYDGSSLAFIYNIGSSYAALYEQQKEMMPELEEIYRDKGITVPELEQAISYYEMFLEMALDNSQQLDDETTQMVKFAEDYIKQHPKTEPQPAKPAS